MIVPDTTTVRSLVTSVTKLSRHLDLTPNAIYRWIAVDRIPGKYLIKVANFYDVELPLHLAQSDKKNPAKINIKPKNTIEVCLKVQQGELTLEDAAKNLGVHVKVVQLIIANWGEGLQTLYTTLKALESKTMSLDEAAKTLNVSKFNIHALRRKYGFQPKRKPKAPPKPIVERRKTAKAMALDAIAGRVTLADVESKCNLSWRTIHRAICKLSPDYSLIELTHWPKSLREAYSSEIAHNVQKISVNLWKYVQLTGIPFKKWPKYPESPKNWRAITTKKMMIHILLGAETLESAAERRGADPKILEALFTSDLRPLNLTWPQVAGMPVLTQIAVAELYGPWKTPAKHPEPR